MKTSASHIVEAIHNINPEIFYSKEHVQKTPLIYSDFLSKTSSANVYLKCENLQNTGSFKLRGAMNSLINLTAHEKTQGIITASSGNHGAAVAFAAQKLSIPVEIYVPENISYKKEEKILALGAELIKVDGNTDTAEKTALLRAENLGKTYISPYNNSNVIAGQGTVGVEIFRSLPTVDAIFISVGGGGLISGVGSITNTYNQNTQVIGCWPAIACSMLKCIEAGDFIEVEEQESLSDGTAGEVEVGSITLDLCKTVISKTEVVSEEEISFAMKLIYEEHGLVIEGAAGVAVASFLKLKSKYKGKNVVIVLCGKNISNKKFRSIFQK